MKYAISVFACLLTPAWAITLSAPATGSISGTVVFTTSLLQSEASIITSVAYYCGGQLISNSAQQKVRPFALAVDTARVPFAEGDLQCFSQGFDVYGNPVAASTAVNYAVSNANNTTLTYNSPALGSALSGTVTFSVTFQSSYSSGVIGLAWYVDGAPYGLHGSSTFDLFTITAASTTRTLAFDTTKITNGTHLLTVATVPGKNAASTPLAMSVTRLLQKTFTVSNSVAPIEIRTGIHRHKFEAGNTGTVTLAPVFYRNDGTTASAGSVTYASDNTAVATVNSAGVVNPGSTSGTTRIVVSDSGTGLKRVVDIENWVGLSGFAHYTKNGTLSYVYQPGQSIWRRSIFKYDSNLIQFYNSVPTIGSVRAISALKALGANAIEVNAYGNPADTGEASLAAWQAGSLATHRAWWDTAKNNGLCIVAIGDDFGRSTAELNYSNNVSNVCPFCAAAIQQTMTELKNNYSTCGGEMFDEVGAIVYPISNTLLTNVVVTGNTTATFNVNAGFPHGLATGNRIYVSGATSFNGNGYNTITSVPTATSFTVTIPSSTNGTYTDAALAFSAAPTGLQQLMATINATSGGHPPITWEVGGVAQAMQLSAWNGDSTLSNYATIFQTTNNLQQATSPFGWSLSDQQFWTDYAYYLLGGFAGYSPLEKIAATQVTSPRIYELQVSGPGYSKQVAGSYPKKFADELVKAESTSPQNIAIQVAWAIANGFFGVRAYAYGGASPVYSVGIQDAGFSSARATAAIDSTHTGCGGGDICQIGMTPFSDQQDELDRWNAVGNIFRWVGANEAFLLSPMLDSPDYGPCFVPGARQLANGNGRMLLLANACDSQQTIASVSLSAYRFSGGSMRRARVKAFDQTDQPLNANPTTDTNVTFMPGEIIAWRTSNVALGIR